MRSVVFVSILFTGLSTAFAQGMPGSFGGGGPHHPHQLPPPTPPVVSVPSPGPGSSGCFNGSQGLVPGTQISLRGRLGIESFSLKGPGGKLFEVNVVTLRARRNGMGGGHHEDMSCGRLEVTLLLSPQDTERAREVIMSGGRVRVTGIVGAPLPGPVGGPARPTLNNVQIEVF